MVWSMAWKELTDDKISRNRVSVYSFKRRINKGRKTLDIFMVSNLLALLLGKFSILTKQSQTYDSARKSSNFDWKIFYLGSFQIRNVIIFRPWIYMLPKKRKLKSRFFFLTRKILLLIATWFHKSTNISPYMFWDASCRIPA